MSHPEIPKLNLEFIVYRQYELLYKLKDFDNTVLTGTHYDSFLETILECLPNSVLKKTLDNNFKYLLGKPIDINKITNLTYLIAGNLEALINSQIITTPIITEFSWAGAQIIDCSTQKKGNGLSHLIQFKILTGPLASQVMSQYWSFKKTAYLAVYRNDKNLGFGFNKSRINSKGDQRNKLIFNDLRQFYGLRCFVLFDPTRSQEVPYISEIGHKSSTMTYNQKLLRGRDRALTDCVKKIQSNPECYRCPYGVDRCMFATHSSTYLRGSCSVCKKTSFFDPKDLSMCVDCTIRELKK